MCGQKPCIHSPSFIPGALPHGCDNDLHGQCGLPLLGLHSKKELSEQRLTAWLCWIHVEINDRQACLSPSLQNEIALKRQSQQRQFDLQAEMAHRQEKLPRNSETEADFTGDLLFPNRYKNGKEKNHQRELPLPLSPLPLSPPSPWQRLDMKSQGAKGTGQQVMFVQTPFPDTEQ